MGRGGHNKKTHSEFVKEVGQKVGKEYEVLGEYKTAHTKVLVKHNKCGYRWNVRPDNLLGGQRCPRCSNGKKTQDDFEKEIKQITEGEYTVLGKYEGRKEKVLVRHEKCGLKYKIAPGRFLSKGRNRCPDCHYTKSKGEEKISQYLENNSINYKREYKMSGCKHKRNLRFDFALFDGLGNLKRLIEYQGRQHYEDDSWGGIDCFYKTSKRDKIKFDYCQENNIPLLTIPYTKFNFLESILPTEL